MTVSAALVALWLLRRDDPEAPSFRWGIVHDSINPYFGRSRYMNDCQDREWGYKLRLFQRQSGDVKVSFTPNVFTTELLYEGAVSRLISSSTMTVFDHYADFAPGGQRAGETDNGLPPGVMSLAEKSAEISRDRSEPSLAPDGP